VSDDAAAVAGAIRRLEVLLEEMPKRLMAIDEAKAGAPAPGMRWSRKEIVGHLIDSCSNNHQRFVRAQYQPKMTFPRYVQDEWIAAQGYGERPWAEIVELWQKYNRHLLHVMRRVPASAFGNICVVSEGEPSTLGHHMVDYVAHMEHHLQQALA
jgi:hypothetical protein